MKRNRLSLIVITICSSMLISADFVSSGSAPVGNTGAENRTCINCHGGNSLNAAGGSVTIEGLPTTYTPGSTYDFSVKINHGSSNRTRWGFAVKAVTNTTPTAVGTFTETNPNARVSSGEIGQQFAPFSSSSNTYTFNNLKWTAPENPSANQSNITFYVVGNAANGDGDDSGDFIYTATQTITLSTASSVNETILLPENVKIATAGKSILVDLNLSKPSSIQPIIYSLGGQKILSFPAKKYNTGKHNISIDGTHLATGTYIMVIQNNGNAISKQFVF